MIREATGIRAAGNLTGQYIVVCFLAFVSLSVVSCSDGLPPPQVQSVAHDRVPAYAIPLDDEPPLLLDDALIPFVDQIDADAMEVNARCSVCHMNLMQEELVITHARAGMGCAECHGDSDAHIADESWASGGNGTAPDVMYLREKINPFCLQCHAPGEIDPWEHKAFFAGTEEEKFCTDCHGDHRLAERKCVWK